MLPYHAECETLHFTDERLTKTVVRKQLGRQDLRGKTNRTANQLLACWQLRVPCCIEVSANCAWEPLCQVYLLSTSKRILLTGFCDLDLLCPKSCLESFALLLEKI